jgi:predicted metal-binding membrane protein
MSLRRERTFILALLLILAAASWVILVWQSRTASGMGMGAALFLAIWVVMMIAMMFPTVAPMILVFARVQRDRASFGRAFGPTWVFIGAYLLIWTLFGGLSYLGANASSELAQQVPRIMLNAARISGGIYCLGCNWLLFVLLFPLGMMNIAAMALLTALIFAEKCFPLGVRIAQFAALALILYGAFVIVVPAALPLSGPGM